MKSVDDLLNDWEDRAEQGESLSAEELCVDYPQHLQEVRRQIQALQSFASRFGIQHEDDPQELSEDAATRLPERSIRISTEYQLERLHAVGGLGSVYEARDAGLNRRVALKFPRGKRHSEVIRMRFEREARITSRLDHPGIVPVHAIHSDSQGQPCYVMRFIEGQTLQAAIDALHRAWQENPAFAGRYESSEFRELLRRLQVVCNIAAYAHSQGVIHRDIKPSNVMLGAYGETLLVDWGLAKVDAAAESSSAPDSTVSSAFIPSATLPGDSIGTPAFASPEQLQGHVDRISARSDVYSLGATLYCLLTGKHPLSDSDLPKHLDRITRNRLPVPSDVLAGIPAPLDTICRKAMAVEPTERYSSPQELARDLERYLSDEPISLSCEGWRPRTGRWLRKHPVGVAATLITVCFGLLAAAVSSWILGDKNAKLEQANKELTYSYLELGKAWGAKSQLQSQLDTTRSIHAPTLKALTSLSDIHTSTFPDPAELHTVQEYPFLEKLLQQYQGFAATDGGNQEGRYIRALGAWHAGGLLLALGRLPEAEAHLTNARHDLILLQEISLVPAIDQCTAQCCLQLAECHRQAGRHDLALASCREAFTRFDKLIERGRSGLVHPQIDLHRAEALCSLLELSEDPLSEPALLSALIEVQQRLQSELTHPVDSWITTLALSRVMRVRARVEIQQSPNRSLELLEQAALLNEQALRDRPGQRRLNWDLAGCYGDIAGALSQPQAANLDRATQAASRRVHLLRQLASEVPADPKIRAALSSALRQRSHLRNAQQQTDSSASDRGQAEEMAGAAVIPLALLQSDGLGTEPWLALTVPMASTNPLTLHDDTLRKRFDLIESLSEQRAQYVREGNLDYALVTWEREQRLRRDARQSVDHEVRTVELDQGLSPQHWIQEAGDIAFVEIQGYARGAAWGSGPYTDDSDLCTAAIHSGHLQPGEFKTIAVRWRPDARNFSGSSAHGVLTSDCRQYCGGYEILASAVRLSEYNNVLVYQSENKTVDVLVTGDSTGTVTGTDLYGINSDLPTVAVHQGLLKHGEQGIVRVEFLPPLESYKPSTRHSVTSGTLIGWPGTIRVRRVNLSGDRKSE